MTTHQPQYVGGGPFDGQPVTQPTMTAHQESTGTERLFATYVRNATGDMEFIGNVGLSSAKFTEALRKYGHI